MWTRRQTLAGLGSLLGLGLFPPPASAARRVPVGKRLAEPDQAPPPEADTLVVGSGYGASVLARRIAEAGGSVVVLERGAEWTPGSFPRDWGEVVAQVRDDTLAPHALLDMITSGDLDIVAASGLGGTSLINAAICMRPVRATFDRPLWPEAIRAALQTGEGPLGGLEAWYARAEAALGATVDPEAGTFPKARSLADTSPLRAKALGRSLPVTALPLAIAHRDGPNAQGVDQAACTRCGDCCSGCNVGAKNVLTTSYLAAARAAGARLLTGVTVSTVLPDPDGGYRVSWRWVPTGVGLPVSGVTRARRVILGAGSAGSTAILLRSQEAGLSVSDALGRRLSANGDVLGIGYNGPNRVDSVGVGSPERKRVVGQIISSFVDYRAPDVPIDQHFVLLDGAAPGPTVAPVATALAAYALANPKRFPAFDEDAWRRVRRDAFAGLDAVDLHREGAMNHSMLYLACGHDSSGGRYVLEKGRLAMRWGGLYEEPTIRFIEGEMRAHAAATGATFVPNPRTTLFGGRLMAPHPLGGAPMGDDPATGAVDHLGRLFDPSDGGAPRDDLRVVDGAIVPYSLAATPLLTITALAERIAEGLSGL